MFRRVQKDPVQTSSRLWNFLVWSLLSSHALSLFARKRKEVQGKEQSDILVEEWIHASKYYCHNATHDDCVVSSQCAQLFLVKNFFVPTLWWCRWCRNNSLKPSPCTEDVFLLSVSDNVECRSGFKPVSKFEVFRKAAGKCPSTAPSDRILAHRREKINSD